MEGDPTPPLVCLHGFLDTWRTWELVLPALERHHDILAPTLAGHAGGPPIEGEITDAKLADGVERAIDEAGIETAHIVGNSLGGYVALQLAARGRAATVVALAPAGGWAPGDESYKETRGLEPRRGEDHLPSPHRVGNRGPTPPLAVGRRPQLDVPLETAELILGFTSR